MRLAYRTSLAYFYCFPEVWQDFAKYELDTGTAAPRHNRRCDRPVT